MSGRFNVEKIIRIGTCGVVTKDINVPELILADNVFSLSNFAYNYDGYDKNMRNIGVQNGIELFDHFSNHIEKMLAQNGAHTRSFENAIRRNEVLRVQLASIKTDNIGTDIAKTYNHFSNLTTNYNAVLSSTNRINQMSLVNYL